MTRLTVSISPLLGMTGREIVLPPQAGGKADH